jgi:N-acetylglucosaminyl-diphospho-decaprenol L-rhamnosyltransferase
VAPTRTSPTDAASPTGPHAPDVSVIIVSYHCRDHVLTALDRVLSSVFDTRLEVVVVDNGSTDGTTVAVAEHFPEVRIIEMGRNAGFARANNRGMTETTGRYVLILNPDTLVETGAIDRMVEWADDHPWAGMVAPRLVNPDGTDQQTARAFPTPAAALFGRRSPLTRWFPRNRWSSAFLAGRDRVGDEPFRIDWVSGACMLVPRFVIDHLGGFDEDFFLYWEDADWCRRMADGGYETWCLPKAVVGHDEGGTRGHAWPAPVVVHFHRGAYLYWRNHHARQPWHPLRWLAATALAARATAIVARDRLRTSTPGSGASSPSSSFTESLPRPDHQNR